jgi:xanthine dehydrogenase accessory factor
MPEWIARPWRRPPRRALAMVTVVGAQGSTPREAGARLLVWPDRFTAPSAAARWSARGSTRPQAAAQSARRARPAGLSAGPAAGQCCGGHVRLLVEREAKPRAGWAGAARALRLTASSKRRDAVASQGGPHGSDGPNADPEVRRVRNIRPALPGWLMFGAGHVGQAVARAFAPLPFHLDWLPAARTCGRKPCGTRASTFSPWTSCAAAAGGPRRPEHGGDLHPQPRPGLPA